MLRLEARGGGEEMIWLVDGRQIGRSPANRSLAHVFAEPGRHTITALDESGRYDRVEISVR
jgi:penicillin-binding protein 1C